MSGTRNYVMKKRAEAQDATRLKIVEAAMHLHEELGPRATTISAIAERAGVQRLTVYRHFADEFAVFQACTSHWQSLNPPPDPASWQDIADPMARAEAATNALYDYYGRTRRMWSQSFRDVDEVPALKQPMASVAAYIEQVADDLTAAFKLRGASRDRVAATLAHAIHFPTWDHLETLGIGQAKKVALVLSWVRGALEAGGT